MVGVSGKTEFMFLPGSNSPISMFVPSTLEQLDLRKFQEIDEPLARFDFPRVAVALLPYCVSGTWATGHEWKLDQPLTNVAFSPEVLEVCKCLSGSSAIFPADNGELLMFRQRVGLSSVDFRLGPSWIGGDTPLTAQYVGPSASRVEDLMADCFRFLKSGTRISLVSIAIFVMQFIHIHPFRGGNGKTVRCLALKAGMGSGRLSCLGVALSLMMNGRQQLLLSWWRQAYQGDLEGYLWKMSRLIGKVSTLADSMEADSMKTGAVAGADGAVNGKIRVVPVTTTSEHVRLALSEFLTNFYSYAESLSGTEEL